MDSVQQNAKQVMATATLRNIMMSNQVSEKYNGERLISIPSLPLRIAACVTSSVENIKTNPPQAKKKLPRASVGGREGSIDLGGPSQRKK